MTITRFSSYVKARMKDGDYYGYKVDVEGDLLTFLYTGGSYARGKDRYAWRDLHTGKWAPRPKERGHNEDDQGRPVKYVDGHNDQGKWVLGYYQLLDGTPLPPKTNTRYVDDYDNVLVGRGVWVRKPWKVLLKVNVRTKKIVYQCDWRTTKARGNLRYYYVNEFLKVTEAPFHWFRGRLVPETEFKSAEVRMKWKREVRLGKLAAYYKTGFSPRELLPFGVVLGDDVSLTRLDRQTRTLRLEGLERTSFHNLERGREDWEFRCKIVVHDDTNRPRRVCLFGRDPTNQLWLHEVPRTYARSSNQAADRWLMDARRGDAIVATA